MIHPCIKLDSGKTFIPNDTRIEPNAKDWQGVLLVTGPNMGGKSTILRQNCIAVIMA
jgi:DNA mismatch repair protein MSH6